MWEEIRRNRRRSAFVIGAMGVLLVVLGMAMGTLFSADPQAWIAGAVGATTFWLVLWALTLAQGDDIMLGMARAREIGSDDHAVLHNVVEEMSIAAQLGRRPRVFLVDDPSPNAFAAGRDPEKASVAVTTGLLRILDRDELQGVVAHEIGHIKNRDVALITTAGVMMGAIALISEFALRALRLSGGRRRPRASGRKEGGGAILLVVVLVAVVLAPVLAQLLYFTLSRRREYLADASGAMFTRYPDGLARALEKLSGARAPLADTSRITAPMYIVRPLRRAGGDLAAGLRSTHPPIEDRVRILRAMAGGADFAAYERAFQSVRGRRLVGERTLAQSAPVEARPASPGAAAVGPEPERARARRASDALLSASGYVERLCEACPALVKIPPSMVERVAACPRCHGPLGPAESAPWWRGESHLR